MLRLPFLVCVTFAFVLKDVTGRVVELEGPGVCGIDMFRCNDTRCIRDTWRCDGDQDCLDGSDEFDCDGGLQPIPVVDENDETILNVNAGLCSSHNNMFRCDDTKCIRDTWRCDGDQDCPDGSDEFDCDIPKPTRPTPSQDDIQETLTVSETTTPRQDDTQDNIIDTIPATTSATTICITSVPEDSHISSLLSSANRSSDGVNALTDGRYYLFHFELNWFQAVELCHQIGLHSATFNTEVDYNQLIALIRQKNGYDQEASYWTAGSDLGKQGKWVWHPLGRPLMYTRWGRGEPSNLNSENPVERCVEIKGAKGYTMNDCPCDIKYYVICENNEYSQSLLM